MSSEFRIELDKVRMPFSNEPVVTPSVETTEIFKVGKGYVNRIVDSNRQ